MSTRNPRFAIGLILATILAAGALVVADPASPVTVTIADSPDPVASGAQLLYTITVVNTGGSKLTKVLLSDQVNGIAGIGTPPQLQLSSTRGSCGQSGNLVTCDAGTIEGNGSWVVTIRGVVTAANGTVINDTATVSGTRSAQNFTTTSTATTLVSNGGGSPLADLTIGKAGPTSVVAGSPMTYTLTINNTGTANATGVKVVDTLPAGVTGITASGTSLFVCGVVGQTVTCDGGAVNQGSNATVTIDATAPLAVGTITNTAVVDPDDTVTESNELNNTSALVNTQVTATQVSPLLTIDKTDGSPVVAGNPAWAVGAGPDPVVPGATLTYKIHVVNTASTRADDVRVVDGTQGLVAASVTAAQVITNGSVGTFGGCAVAAPQVTCSIKSLNPGGTMDVTITGQVITSAGSTIFNTATVTGNIQNKGVTATDSEITTVRPAVDLTITKADLPDPVCAASWPGPGGVCQGGLTYTFVVGNSGVEDVSGVVVRDPLPPGTIFVPSKTIAPNFAGGCTVDAANVVTCTGGTVNHASTATIAINVVAPPSAGTITNTVTVDPNNAIFEADETNNTFTQVTQVGTGIDLTVAKHSNHEANFVATRGTLTYTITVTNLGTQDAANIRLRDTLPADTVFRDAVADATHGFTCAQSGGVVECTGGHLQGTESMNFPNLAGTNVDIATITIRILATAYEQPAMHNEVRVDPLGEIAEANELNNVATQDTKVQRGGATNDAFNELTISKIQKTPDPTNTARNAVVTYEIKVGNDGTDPVTGVKVRDTLPAGARYIEATGTNSFLCTQAVAGVVDCIGGQIPDHTPTASGATITITVFAPDTPGLYTNQVEVDPDHTIVEGNEFDNNASATTKVNNGGVGSFNDLTIAKTGPLNVTPNALISYTLVVSNNGSDPALNVAVRDVLPVGETFVSAADSGAGPGASFTCSHSGLTVDCIGATINNGGAGAARTITIVAKAPNLTIPSPGLHNVATVDPDNTIPEGDEFNNSAFADTTVTPNHNLTITKDGPTTATQSDVTDYTIVVTNKTISGPGEIATGVVMHDPLPVGLIPLAVDAGTGNNWACQIAQNPINLVDCVGDLGPGDAVTVTINVFITADGKTLDNVACVDPANLIAESDELDNCSDHGTFVAPPPPTSPDILVSKSVDATTTSPGADLTYTITVSNVGTAKAKGWDGVTGLTVTDTLSSELTFTNFTTTNAWTCLESSGTVTCHDPGTGMDVGDSAQITILAHVKDTATLPIPNSAQAALALVDPSCSDPAGCVNEVSPQHFTNNTATVVTSVGSTGFDLSIAQITDNPDPVAPGQGLKYTVVAVNGGTSPANNVHIRLDLPSAGVTFMSADGSNGFNCAAPVSNQVDCVGNLPGGDNTVITVSFITLLSSLPPDVSLTATIDPVNAFAETDEGNNSKTETTTISSGGTCTACVDLVAAQLTASPEPVASGSGVTVKFQVVNTGDTPTALNPASDPLLSLTAVSDGTVGVPAAPVSSNPGAVTCSVDLSGANFAVTSCKGNLAPGQGVTITLTLPSVTGTGLLLSGVADPNGLVVEFSEGNNTLTQTVIIF